MRSFGCDCAGWELVTVEWHTGGLAHPCRQAVAFDEEVAPVVEAPDGGPLCCSESEVQSSGIKE